MQIHRLETGAVEGGGHLQLTVDPLLAQYRHARLEPAGDHGRRYVLIVIEAELNLHAGIGLGNARKLFFRAGRIVAQGLHLGTGLRPGLLEFYPAALKYRFARPAKDDLLIAVDGPEHVTHTTQAGVVQLFQHIVGVGVTHLHHGAQLLAEEHGQVVLTQIIHVDGKSTASGEGHLAEQRKETAVGTIVVGQQLVVAVELLDHAEKALEGIGIVEIGAVVAHLLIDLCQG